MIVMMLALLTSVAMADSEDEKAGRLFLFQKCDDSGCPTIQGPWPILPGTNRSGKLEYSLWGDKFKFSFSGHGLTPAANYTLIYYPDPWPGVSGLICLGSGQSTPDKPPKGKGKGKSEQKGGNIEIHGKADIKTSLPAFYDANYKPTSSSGAVGAKIWLVLTDDVQCTEKPQMVKWNPASYLFEYNLIVFEYRPGDDEEDD